MGQKSNTLTLRKQSIDTNALSLNSVMLLNSLRLLTYLNYIFNKRGVMIMAESLNVVNNQLYIKLDLFYKSFKISSYKNKIKSQLKETTVLNKYLNLLKVFNTFKKVFSNPNKNLDKNLK